MLSMSKTHKLYSMFEQKLYSDCAVVGRARLKSHSTWEIDSPCSVNSSGVLDMATLPRIFVCEARHKSCINPLCCNNQGFLSRKPNTRLVYLRRCKREGKCIWDDNFLPLEYSAVVKKTMKDGEVCARDFSAFRATLLCAVTTRDAASSDDATRRDARSRETRFRLLPLKYCDFLIKLKCDLGEKAI